MAALLWFAWFAETGRADRVRSQARRDRLVILAVLISCAASELLARGMALVLPFRPRPLFETGLPFKLPDGVTLASLNIARESSFPSDHAVLFFGLAAGIWLVSRRAGVASFAWVLIVIAFPRLYLGLHYASDLLAGAIIGIVIALLGVQFPAALQTLENGGAAITHPPCLFSTPSSFWACTNLANMLLDCAIWVIW